MQSNANEIKKDMIRKLMVKIKKAHYSTAMRREILEELRVKLPHLTSADKAKEMFERIERAGTLMFFGSDDSVNYQNELNTFEDLKETADSCLKGLLMEIELDEQFSTTTTPNTISQTDTVHISKTKVFIVHGRDESLKLEVARFVEGLGLEAIILSEQTNSGSTLIEKFEKHSEVAFAIVLYTACDTGKGNDESEYKDRARQNVILEHGYFIGKLGRENVVALYKDSVEIPSDLSGLVYHKYEGASWKWEVAKEMRGAGLDVDLNKMR